MDIKSILFNSIELLTKSNKIKNPHLDAEILLSHILKKPREYILAHYEKQLTKNQISNFQYLISRRLKGMPIAYLTGRKQFYGLDFYVNKNVLIPRPETELIIAEFLKLISNNTQPITLIDVGTGTGCIIITLAKLLKKNIRHPTSDIRYLATDISKPALTIARKNAKLHKVDKKIKFLYGNLLKPIIHKSKILNLKSKIIITANLPYLTPIQIKNSPTIQYEPKLALSAGIDGLKYYKQLFNQINQITNFKLPITVICEICPAQTTKIKQLIKKYLPKAKTKIKKDLRGLNRTVVIQK